MLQSSLQNIQEYGNYPLLVSGVVIKVYEDYLFDVRPWGGYANIEKCYLFCPFKPKVDDIVAVTFLDNYTSPVIFGVIQKPENVNKDQDYVIEHPSGTKQTMKANGDYEVEDNHGNTIKTASDGVKINDHYIMTEEFVDWFNSVAATLGMGNLAAPVPVNPTHLPGFVANYLKKDKYKTNKLAPVVV
ncbi:MAG TPA: hypothetical protein VMV77_01725 [Bacteroidales bacterium]|nr:hypothetical protein [Bacteroidales bacterium]